MADEAGLEGSRGEDGEKLAVQKLERQYGILHGRE